MFRSIAVALFGLRALSAREKKARYREMLSYSMEAVRFSDTVYARSIRTAYKAEMGI